MRGTKARAIRHMQSICGNQDEGHVIHRIMSGIKTNKEQTLRIRHARCVCDAHVIARVK